MSHKTLIRKARKSDALALAKLIDLASAGMEYVSWQKSKSPSGTVFEYGAAICAAEEGSSSYHNAAVLEEEGAVAGIALTEIITSKSEKEIAAKELEFQVFSLLKEHAVGAFYIDSLACFPEFQGKGYGGKLLDHCEVWGREKHCSKIALLVFEGNHSARRLYHSKGYRLLKQQSSLAPDKMPYEGDVLLLIKKL